MLLDEITPTNETLRDEAEKFVVKVEEYLLDCKRLLEADHHDQVVAMAKIGQRWMADYDETPLTEEWFRQQVGHGSTVRIHGGERLVFLAKSDEIHCDMVMLVERVHAEESHEMDPQFEDHDVLALLTCGQVRRMCGLMRIPVEG